MTRKDAQTAAIIKNQRETIEQLEAKYRCVAPTRIGCSASRLGSGADACAF